MNYINKVSVLSQVSDGFSLSGKRVSAILRIEISEGVATFYLTTVNLSGVESGEYFLFLTFGKITAFFPLGMRPVSITKVFDEVPDIESGFSAGICFVKDGLPTLVAFSSSPESKCSMTDFKKTVAEKLLSEKKKRIPVAPAPPPGIPVAPPSQQPPDMVPGQTPNKVNYKYDDEAVATENYYASDESFIEKLKIIEKWDGENVRTENGDDNFGSDDKAQANGQNDDGDKNEEHLSDSKEYSERHPYYQSVKKDLDEIFFKFPREEILEKNLKDSRWAKITYSENKYYVVGLIKEDGKEKYICYGVPSKYTEEPPKELKGFCSFVPLSVFDMKGDGYFMMFQDAITGECVKN